MLSRRDFLIIPLATLTQAREKPTYVIGMGHLSAADHELAEGYFGIGQATAIMVKPQSSGWLHLRELRGKTVSLIVRDDGLQ